MSASFEFRCVKCGEVHRGMPSFGADRPLAYAVVPEAERERRCAVGSDDCVIDQRWFFVRGCLEIPVHGTADPFVWGVWVSLAKPDYLQWRAHFDASKRAHIGPFLGRLDAWPFAGGPYYPDTMDLKARVHPRGGGIRPLIELEPADHPLVIEQRQGISVGRLAEIYAIMTHDEA